MLRSTESSAVSTRAFPGSASGGAPPPPRARSSSAAFFSESCRCASRSGPRGLRSRSAHPRRRGPPARPTSRGWPVAHLPRLHRRNFLVPRAGGVQHRARPKGLRPPAHGRGARSRRRARGQPEAWEAPSARSRGWRRKGGGCGPARRGELAAPRARELAIAAFTALLSQLHVAPASPSAASPPSIPRIAARRRASRWTTSALRFLRASTRQPTASTTRGAPSTHARDTLQVLPCVPTTAEMHRIASAGPTSPSTSPAQCTARAGAAGGGGRDVAPAAAGADLLLVTDADDPRSDDEIAPRVTGDAVAVHVHRCPRCRGTEGWLARTKVLELFREAERRWPSKLYFAKFDADSLPIPHHLLRLLDEMHAALGAAQPWLLGSGACRGKSASGSAQTFSRSATCHAAGGAGCGPGGGALGEATPDAAAEATLFGQADAETYGGEDAVVALAARRRRRARLKLRRLLSISTRPVREPALAPDRRRAVCAPVADARLVPHDQARAVASAHLGDAAGAELDLERGRLDSAGGGGGRGRCRRGGARLRHADELRGVRALASSAARRRRRALRVVPGERAAAFFKRGGRGGGEREGKFPCADAVRPGGGYPGGASVEQIERYTVQ